MNIFKTFQTEVKSEILSKSSEKFIDNSLKVKKTTLVLVLYFFVASFVFIYFVLPVFLYGKEEVIQLWADSLTYQKIATGEIDYGIYLITFDYNLLGPQIILKLLQTNPVFVFIFNCIIFVTSFRMLRNNFSINSGKLLFFLLLSPVLFSSLLTVNKEIISMLCIVLLLMYYKKSKSVYFLSSLALSILVRWQLTIFVIVFFIISSKINIFRRKRILVALCILFLLSIFYPLFLPIENIDMLVRASTELNIDETRGSFAFLLDIQRHVGGYVLVMIPKALHLIFASSSKVDQLLDPTKDFYNAYITYFQSVVFGVLTIAACLTKKATLKDGIIYMMLIYLMIFCLTPVYMPRYLFPVYILLSVILSRNVSSVKTAPFW